MWLASVVRMSRGCCALLGWCDETARSVTTKDLAYDIANRTFSLAATDHFAVAIVSMISTMRRCVFSMNRSRGNWSSLCIYTGGPRANERSLFVQTEPSGRLIMCSSVGSIVRLIHGKLSCADPCRLGLSQKYGRTFVVSVDQS
jgi:hypothetical protein